MNIVSLSKIRNSSAVKRISERSDVENTHILFREKNLEVGPGLD